MSDTYNASHRVFNVPIGHDAASFSNSVSGMHKRVTHTPLNLQQYGTNEANRCSESARGYARGPSISDKDTEPYQGQTPTDGICSVRYADVRISIP
ncbi:hypothetical protein TNCV_929541 [Trichonephila clavipes]|nr:hypothetical protein TNCV_929541 [Trichonephila clavipes]